MAACMMATKSPLIAAWSQATLVELGTILRIGRRATGAGLQAILVGNVVVQALPLVVVRTMWLGAGSAVAPGVLIHVVLASLLLYFALRERRAQPVRADR